MGFGLQFDRLFAMLDAGTYTPDAFNTGYTDVFAARMQRHRPDQQTVNMSCPGESTDTMINGTLPLATTYWFSSGYGMVKQVTRFNNAESTFSPVGRTCSPYCTPTFPRMPRRALIGIGPSANEKSWCTSSGCDTLFEALQVVWLRV